MGCGPGGWIRRVRPPDGCRLRGARPPQPLADGSLAAPDHERAARLPQPARARLHRSARHRRARRPVHEIRPRRGAGPVRLPLPAAVDGTRDRCALPAARRLGELASPCPDRLPHLADHSRARVRGLRRSDSARPRNRERHAHGLGTDAVRLQRPPRRRAGGASAARACRDGADPATRPRRARRRRGRLGRGLEPGRAARCALGRARRRWTWQSTGDHDSARGRSERALLCLLGRRDDTFRRHVRGPGHGPGRPTRVAARRSASMAPCTVAPGTTWRSTFVACRSRTAASRWSRAGCGWAPRRRSTRARSSVSGAPISSPRFDRRHGDFSS